MGLVKTIGRILVYVLLGFPAMGQGYIQFIENKGQWDPAIKFKGDISTGSFALQANGYRVLLHNKEDLNRVSSIMHPHAATHINTGSAGKIKPLATEKNEPVPPDNAASAVVLHSHAYEMRFLNSNQNPVILPDKPLPTLTNYFIGNDSSRWAGNCHTFQGVTYKNVYPGIDVRYYTSNAILKYDFIVNPGGDISQIAMYFDGVESLQLKNGSLHIKTTVDEVTEMAPYSYQLINNSRQEVPCSFEVKGNIVRFQVKGAYSRSATLVIDPSLIFSTFTGSTSDNWGYTATYDGKGNFYSGGIVFGGGGTFPVSNGAFQKTYQGGNNNTGENQGGFDMAIMKFDPTGANRVYATYLVVSLAMNNHTV